MGMTLHTAAFYQRPFTGIWKLLEAVITVILFVSFTNTAKASNSPDSVLYHHFFFDNSRSLSPSFIGTGGLGTARFQPWMPNTDSSAIRFGMPQYEYYRFDPIQYNLADTAGTRSSHIDYHLGGKKEQHITVNHQQHLRKGLRLGIAVGAHTTPGDFSRQLSSGRRIRLNSSYHDATSRYSFDASFRFFRIFNQENGGITSDSIFENASSLDARTLPIFLDNATSRFRENRYDLVQSYALSNSSIALKWSAYHEFSMSRNSFVFESVNPDSGYFSTFWFDSTATYDSSFFRQMTNEIGLRLVASPNFQASAGLALENSKYDLTDFDPLNYETFLATVRIQGRRGKWDWYLSTIQSFQNGLSNTRAGVTFHDQKLGTIQTDFGWIKRRPTEVNNYYLSNHFSWLNYFENEQLSFVSFNHIIPSIRLKYGGAIQASNHTVFFREDALPQQFNKPVGFGTVFVQKTFRFRKFGSVQHVVYGFTGNENVIRMPELSYFGSLFFEGSLFEKALDLRTGVDVTIWTPYNGYGFMPATGAFYLQDNKEMGGFPMAGFFADLKIKTATITIRMDHFNAGIGSREYYGAWRYPLQGRSLKVGVRWFLVD